MPWISEDFATLSAEASAPSATTTITAKTRLVDTRVFIGSSGFRHSAHDLAPRALGGGAERTEHSVEAPTLVVRELALEARSLPREREELHAAVLRCRPCLD